MEAKVKVSVKTFTNKPQLEKDKEINSSSDSAIMAVEFDNGCHGSIHVSQVAATGENAQQITLYGEQGILMGILGTNEMKILGKTGDEEEMKEIDLPQQMWPELTKNEPPLPQFISRLRQGPYGTGTFIDAIAEDKVLSPNFDDGLRAQRVIDAAIASSARGERVPL